VADLVSGCVHDQRRNVDRGGDVAHVDVERHAHESLGPARCIRVHLDSPQPRSRPFLACDARGDHVDSESLSPPLREARHARLELVLGALAPRPVLVGALADFRSLQDQCSRSLGVGGREQHGERPSF
jgi:hypothetical protein